MSLILNIPDGEASFWKNVYEERYNNLLKKIQPLQMELEQMMPVLMQLGILQKEEQTSRAASDGLISLDKLVHEDGYDPSWKWMQKIEFVLSNSSVPQTSAEIIEEILRREPSEIRTRLLNSIPATLSTAVKAVSSDIRRKQNVKGEYEYFLDNSPF